MGHLLLTELEYTFFPSNTATKQIPFSLMEVVCFPAQIGGFSSFLGNPKQHFAIAGSLTTITTKIPSSNAKTWAIYMNHATHNYKGQPKQFYAGIIFRGHVIWRCCSRSVYATWLYMPGATPFLLTSCPCSLAFIWIQMTSHIPTCLHDITIFFSFIESSQN